MKIEIYRQPLENDPPTDDELESCIFCNENTIYWHEESNRPVCAVCSVVYTANQIPTAPFNY